MFTGLIEEMGTLLEINSNSKSSKLKIQANEVLKKTKIGDSIAVNGICLTVTFLSNDIFVADVMPETMNSTNLNYLSKGSKVNLERALSLNDRLGGHFVSGHIDTIGIIKNIKKVENATLLNIQVLNSIEKFMIKKGSISIDGISLTIVDVINDIVTVSIIPHTVKITTLNTIKIGSYVNIECDMIGKYIFNFINKSQEDNITSEKSIINIEFLAQNGFL